MGPLDHLLSMLWQFFVKFFHRLAHVLKQLEIRLWSLPQHLAMALYQVSVYSIHVKSPRMTIFVLLNVCPHRDSVLEFSQPFSGGSLLDIGFERNVVTKDDDWKEHGMAYLRDALFEVFDGFDDIGGGSSFAEAGSKAVLHVVTEHELPATGHAFLHHIALAENDFYSF